MSDLELGVMEWSLEFHVVVHHHYIASYEMPVTLGPANHDIAFEENRITFQNIWGRVEPNLLARALYTLSPFAALTAGTSSSKGRILGSGPTGVMEKGLICV